MSILLNAQTPMIARPTWTQWIAAGDDDPLTGTPNSNIPYVLFPGINPTENTNAVALTLDFDPDFDHSVYSKVRIWAQNIPAFTDHHWVAEFARSVVFPTALDDPLINGVTLPGSPHDATTIPLTGTASGPSSAAPDVYNVAGRRIQTLLLQLQAGASAYPFAQHLSVLEPIILNMEFLRRPEGGSGLQAFANGAFSLNDLINGSLFTFSEVHLYLNDQRRISETVTLNYWQRLGAIKDENVTLTSTEEEVTWMKGKPQGVVHAARSAATSTVVFRLDSINPALEALAFHTAVDYDGNHQVIRVSHDVSTSRQREKAFALRFVTQDGFVVTWLWPRAALRVTGAFNPGEQDFAGKEFTLTSRITGTSRQLSVFEISEQPMDIAQLMLIYAVE